MYNRISYKFSQTYNMNYSNVCISHKTWVFVSMWNILTIDTCFNLKFIITFFIVRSYFMDFLFYIFLQQKPGAVYLLFFISLCVHMQINPNPFITMGIPLSPTDIQNVALYSFHFLSLLIFFFFLFLFFCGFQRKAALCVQEVGLNE